MFVIIVTSIVVVSTVIVVLQARLPEDNTPPSKVEGLEIYDLHDGKLFLFWDEATDNKKVERYQIIRNGDLLPTQPSYPFFIDTSVVDGITYSYEIRAVDSSGNVGDPSDPESGMSTSSDNVPPSRVEGLVIENAYNGRLNLSWEPAFDNVRVVTYRIYRDSVRLEEERPTTFYQDTGLTNNQNYTYEVSAVDAAGNEGQKSRPSSGIPLEEDSEPPSKVVGLVVTDENDGKLNLTWSPATDNVAVVKYHIYRDGSKLLDEPSTTWYLDTGLNNGQEYTYEVSAVDAQGNEGPKSEPASGEPTSSIPQVMLSGVLVGSNYSISVIFADPSVEIGFFGAFLKVDSNETDRMNPLADGVTVGNITFSDIDSNGLLTTSDTFTIAVQSGHDYQFSLYWRQNEQIIETLPWSVP
jgi:fibronectin type 3 domain-containing protein